MALIYNYITLSTAQQQLSNRLYDATQQFWTPAELTLYIQEALLTFNALTSYWRGDFNFPSVPLQFWYDLTLQPNSLCPFTITDADLYELIQYHLLEPATGVNPWTGVSTQFTADDLIRAVERRRNELLSLTNCTQTRRLTPAVPGRISLANLIPAIPTNQQLAADNFIRANENPLNPAVWSLFGGGPPLQILNDVCIASVLGTDSDELYTGVTLPDDQFVSCIIGGVGSTGVAGVFARSTLGFGYVAFVAGPLGPGTLITLENSLGTTFTATATVNPGAVLLLSCIGTSITVSLDGTVVISITDTNATSGSAGLIIGTSGTLSDTFVTDFSTGAIVSTPGAYVIDIRRLAYLPISNGIPYGTGLYGVGPYGAGLPYLGSVVWPEDSWGEQSFNRNYTLAPAGTPLTYLQTTQPPISFDTDCPPAFGGNYELLTSESGPSLSASTPQTLGIPDNWAHVIKWGALADLFSKESNAKDSPRAEYCNMRYQMGLALLSKAPQLLQLRMGNVPLQIDSVRSADLYQTGWQSSPPGTPGEALHAGMNLLALNPVPSAAASLTATVVQTAPLPVKPNDPVQVSPDDLDAIIDYAQHLAAFKLGGAEFQATIPLFKRFMKQAATYGLKLAEIAEYTSVIYAQSAREKEQNPLLAPAPVEAD
jgi:hypothetical protein